MPKGPNPRIEPVVMDQRNLSHFRQTTEQTSPLRDPSKQGEMNLFQVFRMKQQNQNCMNNSINFESGGQ